MADNNQSLPQKSGSRRLITVFGATGFLGRRIVKHLLQNDFDVRAASRHAHRTSSRVDPSRSGLTSWTADVHNEAEVTAALEGAYGALNAVSLYVEHGGETFRAVHVDAAARVARVAREAGVKHLAHVSGIGSDPQSPARYIKARGEGEQAVQRAFAKATLIRPSVMFGSDDAFLTTLVKMIRLLPVCPLFGSGETKLQPVHVENVAEGITRLMKNTMGIPPPCYEFGGPQIYTYEELLRTIARHLGARRSFIPVPFALWHGVATVSEYVPGAPLTRDQIALMQQDNIVSSQFPGLCELGIEPTSVDAVLGRREPAK